MTFANVNMILTLIRPVLYRLVHFFLELFLNTYALSKKKLK